MVFWLRAIEFGETDRRADRESGHGIELLVTGAGIEYPLVSTSIEGLARHPRLERGEVVVVEVEVRELPVLNGTRIIGARGLVFVLELAQPPPLPLDGDAHLGPKHTPTYVVPSAHPSTALAYSKRFRSEGDPGRLPFDPLSTPSISVAVSWASARTCQLFDAGAHETPQNRPGCFRFCFRPGFFNSFGRWGTLAEPAPAPAPALAPAPAPAAGDAGAPPVVAAATFPLPHAMPPR
eukprot:1180508-Prorocentrum_minimum.AAC.4